MAIRKGLLARILLSLMIFNSETVLSLPQRRAVAPSQSLTSDGFSSLQGSTVTQVPTSSAVTSPQTTGTIPTSLETEGRPASQPFPTASIPSPTISEPKTPTTPTASAVSLDRPAVLAAGDVVDAFQPVATNAPPSQIPSKGGHPIARLNIATQSIPLSTNKFYANLFLGTQGQSVFTHPYELAWSQGSGNAKSWGLAISQVEASQRAFGDPNNAIPGSPASYFINPLGLQSLILSATELGSSTVLTTDTLQTFSVNANLQPSSGSSSSIKFPLVQGMGFVTGIYTNLQPNIESSIFFRGVVSAGSPRAGIFKYQVTLEDGTSWLIYTAPSNGVDPNLTLISNTLVQGPAGWSGTIQIAKNPNGASGESIFDTASGVYPTTASISGSVSGATGSYSLSWSKAGLSTGQNLLMFALPHHLTSFDSATSSQATGIHLDTTTKGSATAVVADSWTLVESALPTDLGFAPWSPIAGGSKSTYSATAIQAILNAAGSEINQDMGAQSNLNSMYYSGKALSKFATIVYTVNSIANSPNLAAQGLAQLKTAFALFATNQQQFPLLYDTDWSGIVSSATYTTGDTGADFGNSLYNDHHFHYGYFIHAASIIGSMDAAWLAQNRDWVNALVRDVSNPSPSDNYFPVFRSFDWYHGHSWAKGLFESGDSKDEESSSEDVMFAYGLKMWGRTTGDASMEGRGNLMLSVLARSLQHYFLMASDNTVQPANFIGNKVTGIMFENKIDHTTYFGGNFEYTQGIHMIPLTPASALTRTKQFVQEEWNTYFTDSATDPASKVTGGWKGILYANLALVDPVASFNFFNDEGFDASWLDGGASRTWYLALAAGLGGA